MDEPELAISMYKKANQYENMIRLISKFSPNKLKENHVLIG